MKSSGASLERLLAQDDIYLGELAGIQFQMNSLYKVSLQVFRDEAGNVTMINQFIRSRSEWVSKTYFLRLSNTKIRLVEFFKSHPDFITPDGRLNEMLRNSSSQVWKT